MIIFFQLWMIDPLKKNRIPGTYSHPDGTVGIAACPAGAGFGQ